MSSYLVKVEVTNISKRFFSFWTVAQHTDTHLSTHKAVFCDARVSITIKTAILLTHAKRTRPLFIPTSNRLTCAHTSGCLQTLLRLWSEPRDEETDTTAERVGEEIILTKHVKAQTAGRRRSDREIWMEIGLLLAR